MDADEQAQHAAEHKAAALHHLGWEMAAGAAIWARTIRDNLALHDEARERFAANTTDREQWERLHSAALVVVVAIDQVLLFERRVRRLTGDADLAKARERFDSLGSSAEDLRDLIAHLDEYAVGAGQRQTGQRMPPLNETYLATFLYSTELGETFVSLGDHEVNLTRAANAAIELAEVAERARAKGLERAEREANAALRQRRGLPAA